MLEHFTYKKIKKHQADKKAGTPSTPTQADKKAANTPGEPAPLLNEEDENFLQRVVSAEGTPPPLPNRPLGWVPTAGDPTGNDAQMVVHNGNGTTAEGDEEDKQDKSKGKENEKPQAKPAKKPSRFSFLGRSGTKKDKRKKNDLKPAPIVPPHEANKEEDDINRVLEELNLSAVNNRAFSLSKESQQLVQQFTVILKDLVNGVPTAYDDLVHLLEDSQGTLAKSYEHLPSFLQKLIVQLPDKLTKSLAPELLAVATEAQGVHASGAAAGAAGATSFSAAAKSFLKPTSLKDLVTKPGAVVSLLKAIMNALKLRWPAFMGTNVLLSLGLFVLLFVFWYCHKRGREVRLEREGKAAATVDSEGRIVELDDDPMITQEPSDQAGPSRSQANGPSSSSQPTAFSDQRDLEPQTEARAAIQG